MTWRSADSDWDQFPPSPFCKPDWRWRFAQHTLRTRVRARRNEDEHVLLALRFLRVSQLAHSRGKMHLMSDRWSNIAQAYSIYLESGERRAETEARLLCQPIALVSEKMGLSVEVLKSFARVFYDVIDIEPITDWLIYEAAGVGRWFRQPPTEAEIWKYWALLGGPTALESLIDDFRRPDSPEAAGEYLEAERVRYLARDFAAQLRNGPIMDRAMLAERQRLFAESDRRRSPDDPFFGHLKFMEMVADQAPTQRAAGLARTSGEEKTARRKPIRNGDCDHGFATASPPSPSSDERAGNPAQEQHEADVA